MTNLNLYKIFLAVAEEKNLTKASNRLYVTQPAVSNSIKELEASLGFELFIRKNKGVELTPYGEKLYEKCKSSIERLQDVEEYFEELKQKNSGLIKIGVNTSNLNQLFFDTISSMLAFYPNIEVSITRYSENELYEYLEMGKLDYIAVDSEFSKDNLEIVTEFNIGYEIIGNKEYYESYKKNPLTIKKVAEESLILANKSYTSRNNIDEFFRRNYISLSPKFELDGYTYVRHFVEMGHGISIVNPYYFADAIKENKLYIINKNFDFPKRKIILAKSKMSNTPEVLNVFEQTIHSLVNDK